MYWEVRWPPSLKRRRADAACRKMTSSSSRLLVSLLFPFLSLSNRISRRTMGKTTSIVAEMGRRVAISCYHLFDIEGSWDFLFMSIMPKLAFASPRNSCMVRSDFCRCPLLQSHRALAHQTSQAGSTPHRLLSPGTSLDMELQSLDIDSHLTRPDPDDFEDGHPALSTPRVISPFFESLLQRCAPTLKSVVWDSILNSRESETISIGDDLISFPCLRQLKLAWVRLSPTLLSSCMSAPLRQLALSSFGDCESMENILANCESLRNLQVLLIPRLSDLNNVDTLVNFLGKHNHLQKLCVEQSVPALLDSHIVPPTSTGNFSTLFSLSLSWEGPGMDEATRPHIATVPEESIAAIGTIVSLEQLSLTAGVEVGWRYQWLANHKVLRANLTY